MSVGLFFIDVVWVEREVGFGESKGCGVGSLTEVHSAVKTSAATGVAGAGTQLIDVEDDGVLIAVGPDFVDFLHVSGSGSFVPDFLSTAGVINRLAKLKGHFQRLGVHVSKHERFFGRRIHGQSGDESVGVEFWGKDGVFFKRFFVRARSEGDGCG